MYKKDEGLLKIGIIKELKNQGILTEEEEENIVRNIKSKYDIE